MIDSKTLGNRIRYFRKRSGMSQLELEMEIGASAGMLSRIENGKVNPQNETIWRIFKVLDLSEIEIDYLIGSTSLPATEEEIGLAIEEIAGYFDRRNVYGYLLDDRFRLLYLSRGFERILGKLIEDYENMIKEIVGSTIVRILIDEDLGVAKILQTKDYEYMLYLQLARIRKYMGFMEDDPSYMEIIKVIENNSQARKIWGEVNKENINVNDLDSRRMGFRVYGQNIYMHYSKEPIWNYPRFRAVEYIPNSKVVRFINKWFN